MSPTARSLIRLRRLGFTADVVERFIADKGEHGQGIRRDWDGFGDILAAHPRDLRILLVQSTTLENLAARLAKARGRPELAAWLKAGGAFEVHGWDQRNGRWAVKRVAVRPGDLAAEIIEAPPASAPKSKIPFGRLVRRHDMNQPN